jgi:glycosyltransferase involved in cell wall biosynthesis
MQISIGILAWNEERSIGKTIESVLSQSLFIRPRLAITSIELICVPNGCSDNTADVARRAASEFAPHDTPFHLECRVCDVDVPGKGNAWNEFIHRFADQQADVVIMLDADVELLGSETLENMVEALVTNTHAHVATPARVKHIASKPRKSLYDRISLGASEIGQSRPAMLAGCLYCARANVLRRIWLPAGLVGEDAFLCAMLVTDLFTHHTDHERVVRAPNAAVRFESYTKLRDVFYNLRRRAITRGINAMMYTYLWENVGKVAPDAGSLIKQRNDDDPDWFRKLVRQNVKNGSWWIMPKGVLGVRLMSLGNLRWSRRLALLPTALIASAADLIVHVSANRAIREGRIRGIWQNKAVH